MKSVNIVIAGAGPVGLLTAIELTLGGASVMVLEKLAGINPTIKALSVGPLGAEALQRRGMGPALDAAEARNATAMQAFTQQFGTDPRGKASTISGHFAGLPLIRKDAQREPGRRNRLLKQQDLEEILGARARELGIAVHRECAVTGLTQHADSIDVAWQAPDGSDTTRCAWLVGCDGGRSTIRKLAGFAFPGTDPTSTMYHCYVTVDRPELLAPVGWQRTPRGVFAYGPFPGRLFMLDFDRVPAQRDAPVTREEVERLLRHISGKDVRVTQLDVGNRWTDNTRLVDTYRSGRVLLAGDAAHIHSPFGGQGLNLGLTDAANLGWKLAAVVRGDKPDSLLDTYTAERRPVAQAVLANTLAQLALLRPDPQSGALRDLFAQLMADDGANRLIGEMTSGLGARYALGSDHADAGRLIGDQLVTEGNARVPLFEVMQGGAGAWLSSPTGPCAPVLAAGALPLRSVAIDTGPAMLVRPDGCIAWAGDESDGAGLDLALRQWFGRNDGAGDGTGADAVI